MVIQSPPRIRLRSARRPFTDQSELASRCASSAGVRHLRLVPAADQTRPSPLACRKAGCCLYGQLAPVGPMGVAFQRGGVVRLARSWCEPLTRRVHVPLRFPQRIPARDRLGTRAFALPSLTIKRRYNKYIVVSDAYRSNGARLHRVFVSGRVMFRVPVIGVHDAGAAQEAVPLTFFGHVVLCPRRIHGTVLAFIRGVRAAHERVP
ncbi:Uncharacterised protein [Mycobacteroides abscessus subsp. abscessus]|nr:Uncharacterised protein [Mycobacteroides abscessus subsp. abscessus]SKR82956.1 Uncharacterised protein [Mycobacteroides abscessus subsp. abscessus]SKR85746.1 Uncharacterised protein [Mycobacteroides abscessus subsp. abscessus]SKT39138.1 Uncharacterised protein [Mycobacteroides abscessus subsp. abscessus]